MKAWPLVQLGELGAVATGSTPKTSEERFFGGSIPFVTPGELDQAFPVVSASRTLTDEGAGETNLLPENAVMVCCIGSLGKVGIAGRPLATNQQINSIVFDTSRILPRFGYYACRRLKPQLEAMAPATTIAIVNKSKFETLSIPVPPLSDQQRIVVILDQAIDLCWKRKLALDRLSQLKLAMFHELFGDPSAMTPKWPLVKIGDLLSSAQYGTSAKANGTGRLPILRMNNITYDGELDLADLKFIDLSPGDVTKYTVTDRDILFNRTNSPELVGKTAVVRSTEQMAFAGYLVRLRTNEQAIPEYVSAFLNSPFGKKILRGMAKTIIGMANINAKEVQTIPIMRPPIEVQHVFARRVAEVDKLKQAQRINLLKLDELFESLQNRAFRGEL
jgi:type I restriction enzyme, S subunit